MRLLEVYHSHRGSLNRRFVFKNITSIQLVEANPFTREITRVEYTPTAALDLHRGKVLRRPDVWRGAKVLMDELTSHPYYGLEIDDKWQGAGACATAFLLVITPLASLALVTYAALWRYWWESSLVATVPSMLPLSAS
ncbi:uncharacterized protein BXZ73DRAFT_105085 [Epithele typhae]|uniref:uncharacterized protein n=1 Tax=Epithele typhae TaxID=378194 RepID=UPI002008341C|nr:uncharacterized protein BXZ73DRAFT_105085 [Epithele typhae]KAH9918931.1 hypothetical protein BXZ73DRAFT_105085 [Epithele typhae]